MEHNHEDHGMPHGGTHSQHEVHDPHTAVPTPHARHGRHAGHSVAMFREKFWLSLALTLPVVIWSKEVQH